MTTTLLEPALTPAPAARILPRLATDSRYVLSGFPLAIAAILVPVTALALGLGLAILWLGVPIMMFALMQARGFATAERERIAGVLGREIKNPSYRTVEASRLPAKLVAVLIDARTWRDVAHASVRWIPSTISCTVVATWWAAVIGGLSWGLWGWALPSGDTGLPELLGFGDAYLTNVVFYGVLAVPFLLTLPVVARKAALMEARFAERLLAG